MSERAGPIERFLYAPSSGYRLAAFRIAFGLFLLGYFGALLPHVELMFSDRGVHLPYLLPDYAPPPAVAWTIFIVMVAVDVALIAGYRTELAARLLLLLFLYHYFLQLAVKQSSFDRLIIIYLVVLAFSDAGRVVGLDARRPGPRPCVWGERLLAAQTVLLYFGSGLWKLCNPGWHDGALLRSNLMGMWASPLAFAIVRMDFSERTWAWLSWSIIAFELLLGPLLLLRRTRWLGFALGVGFHLFNTVVLVIPEFLVAATPYPVFMDAAWLERTSSRSAMWTRKLRARLARDARAAEG